ncbi:hypothetical protein DT603_12925 [Pseudoxanthomonas gei]|uniref:Uncharacterized protein n=1 Tax=Pseudoxanthomonas gei TaxID=1383030 RepID=A0ABX0AJR9_9GAMM|nr:hypothetical protein [Pseudoxanthomonas gei]NDK39746.1 hypothetical protein [Pseudoxanthomonas gei]
MGNGFWIRRFFTVVGGAFLVICAAQLLRGHALPDAALQGAIWGAISATVFTVSRFLQARQGRHCAVCKDTPEMQEAGRREAG